MLELLLTLRQRRERKRSHTRNPALEMSSCDEDHSDCDPLPDIPADTPAIETLGINPSGPRMCMKFSYDGPVSFIPWEGTMKKTFGWNTTELKLLDKSRIEPYGWLYIDLAIDENGRFTQAGKLNRHIPGVFGDAYVVSHFEAMDMWQGCDPKQLAWWGRYKESTHFAYPIREERMYWIALNFEMYKLTCFNPLERVKQECDSEIIMKVRLFPQGFYDLFMKSFDRYVKSLKIDDAEVVDPFYARSLPFSKMVLVKSSDALLTYTAGLISVFNRFISKHDELSDIPILAFGGFRDLQRIRYPGSRSPVTTVAKQCARIWIRMQQRFVKTFDDAKQEHPVSPTEHCSNMSDHERAYWDNYDKMRSEEQAKEVQRKIRATAERARRIERGNTYVYHPAPQQVQKKGGKKYARHERTQNQRNLETQRDMAHNVHITKESRELARERFKARQEQEHHDRIEREARKRAEASKNWATEMSASEEAKSHIVPVHATIGDALAEALEKSQMLD